MSFLRRILARAQPAAHLRPARALVFPVNAEPEPSPELATALPRPASPQSAGARDDSMRHAASPSTSAAPSPHASVPRPPEAATERPRGPARDTAEREPTVPSPARDTIVHVHRPSPAQRSEPTADSVHHHHHHHEQQTEVRERHAERTERITERVVVQTTTPQPATVPPQRASVASTRDGHGSRAQASARTPPPVHVTIGRIVVSAESPKHITKPAPEPRAPAVAPAKSLAEILAAKQGGRR